MPRARTAAVLGAVVAMAATAATTAHAATPAEPAATASVRYAVGSPGMQQAQLIAEQTWGMTSCGALVEVSWGADEANVNARAFWSNPVSPYGAPERNSACRIVMNAGLDPVWSKFCTVLVHEYGHLAGRPHGEDGDDVMSPMYRTPIAACAMTPDPAGPISAPVTKDPAARTARASGAPVVQLRKRDSDRRERRRALAADARATR